MSGLHGRGEEEAIMSSFIASIPEANETRRCAEGGGHARPASERYLRGGALLFALSRDSCGRGCTVLNSN